MAEAPYLKRIEIDGELPDGEVATKVIFEVFGEKLVIRIYNEIPGHGRIRAKRSQAEAVITANNRLDWIQSMLAKLAKAAKYGQEIAVDYSNMKNAAFAEHLRDLAKVERQFNDERCAQALEAAAARVSNYASTSIFDMHMMDSREVGDAIYFRVPGGWIVRWDEDEGSAFLRWDEMTSDPVYKKWAGDDGGERFPGVPATWSERFAEFCEEVGNTSDKISDGFDKEHCHERMVAHAKGFAPITAAAWAYMYWLKK